MAVAMALCNGATLLFVHVCVAGLAFVVKPACSTQVLSRVYACAHLCAGIPGTNRHVSRASTQLE